MEDINDLNEAMLLGYFEKAEGTRIPTGVQPFLLPTAPESSSDTVADSGGRTRLPRPCSSRWANSSAGSGWL